MLSKHALADWSGACMLAMSCSALNDADIYFQRYFKKVRA
jgi:hypothetical protein